MTIDMPRRRPYTKLVRNNRIQAEHAKGMGDVVFKGFQCLNHECDEFIFVRLDDLDEDFAIECPRCGYVLRAGGQFRFFDYSLVHLEDGSTIEEGEFAILHDAYLDEALEYKYCILCSTMKPLSSFDRHNARRSGRQGECRLCKQLYNAIKNQSRIPDQHREAAEKRRLYLDLSGGGKLQSTVVHKRFAHRCFKCGKHLLEVSSENERPLDHTLPAVYLWPRTTLSATLLCAEHNGEKSGKWPSDYYDNEELRRLSVLTGIDYKLLAGPPTYNPEAIDRLKRPEYVDALLAKFSKYMPEIIRLRNRILVDMKFDFFQYSTTVSPEWIRQADKELERRHPADHE